MNQMVELTILGQPYSKARPRVTSRGTYTPQVQRKNAERISWEIKAACGKPLTSNVAVVLRFYRSNRQRIDLDNLVKQVLDAANGIAWLDDAQVTSLIATKDYDCDNPRTFISIEECLTSSFEQIADRLEQGTCEKCGDRFEYVQYPSQPPKRWCSKECRRTLTCPTCQGKFHPRAAAQRFCCRRCGMLDPDRNAKISENARARGNPLPVCRDCGKQLARHGAVLCRDCWLTDTHRRKRDLSLPPSPKPKCRACGAVLKKRNATMCTKCWGSRSQRRKVSQLEATHAE